MFLVPLDTPGVEIQPIHTLSNERTNATYYSDVRIPDRYRIGPVDGGWSVLGHALHLEHGSNGEVGSAGEFHDMIAAAADWASTRQRGGRPMIEDERVREEIGRAQAASEITTALGVRQLWIAFNKRPVRGEGAMLTAFKKDALIDVSTRLMALAAPESLLRRSAGRWNSATDSLPPMRSTGGRPRFSRASWPSRYSGCRAVAASEATRAFLEALL